MTSKSLILFVSPIVNIPPPLNLATLLADKGHQVLLVGYKTKETPSSEKLTKGANIFRIDLRSRRIGLNFLRLPLSLVEYLFVAYKIYRRYSPDNVVLFNDPAPLLTPFLRKVRVKICWLLEYPEKQYMGKLQYKLMILSSYFWRHCDALVFPSNSRLSLALAKRPKNLHRRNLVVHNAPRFLNNTNKHKKKPLESDGGIGFLQDSHAANRMNIIYTGAVGNRYGMEELVKAVGDNEKYSLLIVGKKHSLSMSEFKNAHEKTTFSSRIKFIDQVPYNRLHELLCLADLGHVYYDSDTLNTRFSAPGKMYEYLKAGLMILTDQNACILDYLKGSRCALIYNSSSQSDLSLKLRDLSSKKLDLEESKTNARNLFESHFNFEEQTKELMETYFDKVT